jgi:D-galactarolactone cycloisomerase
MIDVNRGWDLATAIEGARLLEPLRPRWLEEPVRWADDRRELKLLAQKTRIPLSAGESELTSYGCRALLEEQAIQILQFDCTMMGGFTEGRKLAALCELNSVQVAPHHDCFIHAHIVAEPGGLHRRVVHRPRARSAAGRAVRGSAEDRAGDADAEGAAGLG